MERKGSFKPKINYGWEDTKVQKLWDDIKMKAYDPKLCFQNSVSLLHLGR